MCDYDPRRAFQVLEDPMLEDGGRDMCIQGREGVIEDRDGLSEVERTGDGYSLTLTAGEGNAFLADVGQVC